MTASEIRQESLSRAVQGQSLANYPAIIEGFMQKGIPEAEINPRENVFTFNAWKALGRSVKKGEHGVKVFTFAESTTKDEQTGKELRIRRPWSTTVFHVSQTEPSKGREPLAVPSHEPRPEPAAAAVVADGSRIAQRFRKAADSLEPKIEHASRPMTQNPTPKRNREYQGRMFDARNMERYQKALRALADIHDKGTIPAELAGITTPVDVSRLVRKSISGKGGYYSVIECDDYAETSIPARMVQAMIDGNAAHRAERERLRKVGELEADVRLSSIPGFFPTPEPVVSMMVDAAELRPGLRVLEPSAGSGNIADALRAAEPAAIVDVCEIQYRLQELLKLKGHNVIASDFTECELGRYDRIVMNPPFEKQQDIDHVRRAYDLLEPGGILVSIMSPGFEFRSDRKSVAFREWLGFIGAQCEKLPDGSFKQSGTGVASRMVVIQRRESSDVGAMVAEYQAETGCDWSSALVACNAD